MPLVFLHAFPLSSAMWDAQLAEFGRDFAVLAPDLRGIGCTSPFEGAPSVETLAHDVALWLETIGVESPVVLCGLSMGGYVALEWARLFPRKLRALVLCDTRADADGADARQARDEMIAFARTHDGAAVAEKMRPKLLGQSTLRENPEVARAVQRLAAPNAGQSLAQLVAAMRDRRDSTELLGEIRVPSLVLGGAEDAVSPPQLMGEMAARIPGARHETIERAGHLSNLEQPEQFNARLRQFLACDEVRY